MNVSQAAGSLVLLCLSLGGCTNLDAVRSYAGQTRDLTAAFIPMLDGSVQSCKDRKTRIKLYTSAERYDPKTASDEVKELCAPIVERNKYAAELAQTLTDYANILDRIAGSTVPTALNSSEDDLKTALTKLTDKIGQPIVSDTKIAAATSLAKYISENVISALGKEEIRKALNHHEAVDTMGNALITYTKSNYIGYVNDEKRDLETVMRDVGNREDREYLAARHVQEELWEVKQQLNAKEKAAEKFEVAVNKMIETHKDLIAHVDDLGDKERLIAVFAFTKEVRGLKDQLNQAF